MGTIKDINDLMAKDNITKIQNAFEPYKQPLRKIPEAIHLSHWLSGEAAFVAMKDAIDRLVSLAPDDHDVIIKAFNISVREVEYVKPHTLLFSGLDNQMNDTFVVVHYSQLVAHVVYLPKTCKERVITGFAKVKDDQ